MKHVRMAAVALAALISVTSCDKNDNDKPATLSRVQAKWGLQSYQIDLPGTEDDVNYTGVAADYLDFRADNKLYSQVGGDKDTSAYSLINDNTLVIDGDTAKIASLSSSQFVITQTTTNEGITSKVTYNLKK